MAVFNKYPINQLTMKVILVGFCVVVMSFVVFGQGGEVLSKRSRTIQGDGARWRLTILPKSVAKNLDVLLLTEMRASPYKLRSPRFRGKGDLNLLRVTEYFRTAPWSDAKGITTSQTVSHPVFYPALIAGEELYVFSTDDLAVDSQVFNRFVRRAQLSVNDVNEAYELARLYLAASQGYDTEKRKILSNVDDVPGVYRSRSNTDENVLRTIVRKPQTVPVGDSYVIELYGWEAFSGKVKRWTLTIARSGLMTVENVTVGKL